MFAFWITASLALSAVSADGSSFFNSSSLVQFNCIDVTGKIRTCPGNTRPREFGSQLVAYSKFANRINETGWAELELVSNGQLEDHIQAYYAGYLEGFVTAKLIRSHRSNLLEEQKNAWCSNLTEFIAENLNYTARRVRENVHNPYWQQVGLTLYQLAGLDDGSTDGQGAFARFHPHMNVKPCGIILLNLYTELGDIQQALKQTPLEPRSSHCSAIVKVLPTSGDVLVAHNTWTSYKSMLRIMKKYSLHFSTSQAKSVAMSSYPGTLFSIDDFYITSANLVVLETSIENYNSSLWQYVRANSTIFEFIRNTLANRLASSGQEWAVYFGKQNSGTYSNQFMIVDYKQLGKPSGLLTILEQMPGMIDWADKTDHLLEKSYWSSYNVPYFESIYRISEQDKMVRQFGDFFTYDKTARALIFKRDHSKVANLTSLYHLMRYNDMYKDPLSRCNCSPPYTGEYAIAARCDLNDKAGRYPIDNLKFRPHGAIDAKMTSSKLASNLQMVAVSGPTDENVPPFSWATTKIDDQPHLDQPIEWRFKPVKTVWHPSDAFPNFQFDS